MGIGADGPGLYNYTRGSPITMSDPTGASADTVTPNLEGGGPRIRGGFGSEGPPPPARPEKPAEQAPEAKPEPQKLEEIHIGEKLEGGTNASKDYLHGEETIAGYRGTLRGLIGFGSLRELDRALGSREFQEALGDSWNVTKVGTQALIGLVGTAIGVVKNIGKASDKSRSSVEQSEAGGEAGGGVVQLLGTVLPLFGGKGGPKVSSPVSVGTETTSGAAGGEIAVSPKKLGLGLGESTRRPRPGYRQWSREMGFQTWDEITTEMAETHGDLDRVRRAMEMADELHFNMEGFTPPKTPLTETSGGAPIGGRWTDLEYALTRLKYGNKAKFWQGKEPYRGAHPY
jgi:hypothetical protein